MAFDPVEPRGVGGGENQLHIIFGYRWQADERALSPDTILDLGGVEG